MPKWTPCKRPEFIKKLKRWGFMPPEPGGRHWYLRYETYTLTLPSNKEYSVAQVKMLLKEIEVGTGQRISLEEWEVL
jgi:hypothetical protein